MSRAWSLLASLDLWVNGSCKLACKLVTFSSENFSLPSSFSLLDPRHRCFFSWHCLWLSDLLSSSDRRELGQIASVQSWTELTWVECFRLPEVRCWPPTPDSQSCTPWSCWLACFLLVSELWLPCGLARAKDSILLYRHSFQDGWAAGHSPGQPVPGADHFCHASLVPAHAAFPASSSPWSWLFWQVLVRVSFAAKRHHDPGNFSKGNI